MNLGCTKSALCKNRPVCPSHFFWYSHISKGVVLLIDLCIMYERMCNVCMYNVGCFLLAPPMSTMTSYLHFQITKMCLKYDFAALFFMIVHIRNLQYNNSIKMAIWLIRSKRFSSPQLASGPALVLNVIQSYSPTSFTVCYKWHPLYYLWLVFEHFFTFHCGLKVLILSFVLFLL